MKFALLPLLLSCIPLVQSQMPVGSTMRCHDAKWTDKAWTDAKNNMRKAGTCLYYKTGDPGYDISTCGKGCEGGVEAVGCMAKEPEGLEDPKGNCFWTGTCICPKDVEWVGDLIVMIVDALNEFFQKIVDALVCSGILDAIIQTVDIGLSLIPGGAFASTAMRTGIRIAKSVAEAGSDRSAFEEWFGAQCGSKPTDIDKVWKEWTGVPDDVLPSFPGGECVKSGKKKKGCKKQPSKDDDEKREKEAKEKWEKDHQKKTSSKKQESPSTSAPKTQPSPKPTSASTSRTSSKAITTSKSPSSSKASASSQTPKSKASASSEVPSSGKSTGGPKTKTASASSAQGSSVPSKSAATSKSVPSSGASKASTAKNTSKNTTKHPTKTTAKASATASAPKSSSSSPADDEDDDESEKPDIPGIVGTITSAFNLTTSAKLTSTSAPVFVTSGPGH